MCQNVIGDKTLTSSACAASSMIHRSKGCSCGSWPSLDEDEEAKDDAIDMGERYSRPLSSRLFAVIQVHNTTSALFKMLFVNASSRCRTSLRRSRSSCRCSRRYPPFFISWVNSFLTSRMISVPSWLSMRASKQ